MRLLLDTHALIWWWTDDPLLGRSAGVAIADPGNSIYVSAVTGWEIATKVRKGQLTDVHDYLSNFDDCVADEGFRPLSITLDHGVRGGRLPGAHKDPFDRLIAAQALADDLMVVTHDPQIAAFGCKVLW